MDVLLRSAVLLWFTATILAQSPVDLVREKRYAEARKAMSGMPEPTEARQKIAFHRLRAAIASGLGEHARAADEMAAALAVAPEDPGLLLATSVAELQAMRLDQALAHASRVDSAAAAATVGDIQEKRREYVAAARAYQRAVELDPKVEAYRVALALELVRHATFEPARVVLEQAAPLFPRSAKIRTLLGVTYYALEDEERATSALLDALAVDSKLEPAYSYLARVTLQRAGEPDARVKEVLCTWDKVICAALKLRSDPKDEAAIATLEAAQGAVARCELGRVYEQREQWTQARVQLEQCVRLDGSPKNHYRLGRVYRSLGLIPQSTREMERYREATRKQSEEASRRQAAVQAFEVVVR